MEPVSDTSTGRTVVESITELQTGSPSEGRRWSLALVDSAGRRYVFTAELSGRNRTGTPQGTKPHEQPWTEEQILLGVEGAVRRAFASGSDGGTVGVAAYDLYKANDELP